MRLAAALALLAAGALGSSSGALAVDAEAAPALWDREHPEEPGAVTGVDLAEQIAAGHAVAGTIRLAGDFPVTDMQYQVCEVGQACFAIGVPMRRNGNEWTFDTRDIPDHSPAFDKPPRFHGGQEVGIQFFVYWPGAQEDGFDLFPAGLPPSDPLFDDDFAAWSRTHYFTTHIVADRDVGGIGFPTVLVTLAGAVVAVAVLHRARPG